MKIIRNDKEIELTYQEMLEAHEQVVKGFMAGALMGDFGLDREEARIVADKAYDRYCEGNGETEYECIEWAYNKYAEKLEDKTKVVISNIIWNEACERPLPSRIIFPKEYARKNFGSDMEQIKAVSEWLEDFYKMKVKGFNIDEMEEGDV